MWNIYHMLMKCYFPVIMFNDYVHQFPGGGCIIMSIYIIVIFDYTGNCILMFCSNFWFILPCYDVVFVSQFIHFPFLDQISSM